MAREAELRRAPQRLPKLVPLGALLRGGFAGYEHASIRLSTERKGRKRRAPVWIARYRTAGEDSARVLGKAWRKRSGAPEGFLTRGQAEVALRELLVTESATAKAAAGATFDRVADAYVGSLEARIRSGTLRGSTLRTYVNIIEKEPRAMWGGRRIASITSEEVVNEPRVIASLAAGS